MGPSHPQGRSENRVLRRQSEPWRRAAVCRARTFCKNLRRVSSLVASSADAPEAVKHSRGLLLRFVLCALPARGPAPSLLPWQRVYLSARMPRCAAPCHPSRLGKGHRRQAAAWQAQGPPLWRAAIRRRGLPSPPLQTTPEIAAHGAQPMAAPHRAAHCNHRAVGRRRRRPQPASALSPCSLASGYSESRRGAQAGPGCNFPCKPSGTPWCATARGNGATRGAHLLEDVDQLAGQVRGDPLLRVLHHHGQKRQLRAGGRAAARVGGSRAPPLARPGGRALLCAV